MAKRFLVSVDLGTNELQNAVVQNLPAASEPSGVKGRVYFDSTNNALKIYDGTAWQQIAFGTNAASSISISGDVTGSGTVIDGVLTVTDMAIQADSVALGTDTTGNYVSDVTGGTGVTVTHTPGEGSSPSIAIGQDVSTTASPSFADLTLTGDLSVNGGDVTTTEATINLFNTNATTVNFAGVGTAVSIGSSTGTTTVNNSLTVTGDLVVNGNTTTLNTTDLNVEDNTIVLNSNVTGSPIANAGVEVERGTETNVSILWNETSDSWSFTNNGTTFYNMTRKATFDVVGDASTTDFAFTHNLGTREVVVQVYYDANDIDGTYDTVETQVERTGTNSVNVKFAAAPATGKNYKVVIIG
jgi:hypothetical protein